MDAALTGDLPALQREVKEAQRAGDLDRSRVEELAWAIAGRELRSAKGDHAVEKVRTLRPCRVALLNLLEERAGRSDDAAAEATQILLELGKRDARRMAKKYRDASSGAWRAVAARATTRAKDGLLRRQLFVDPDERVRRAALQAAVEAQDADDVEALLEAARLDPDPVSRSTALRAVGAIGSRRAILALADLWPRADETTRVNLVDAWAMPATFRKGGRTRLVRIAENEQGLPALNAAGALARHEADADLGNAVLARAVDNGSATEQRVAIQLGSVRSEEFQAALERAASSDDLPVRVLALARLVGEQPKNTKYIKALRALAANKKDEVGVEARAALSAAGDHSVETQLVAQLAAPQARHRSVAAVALLRLGRYSRAATALADDDPVVRTTVACSILSADN